MPYKLTKTIEKAISPPLYILGIAAITKAILAKAGIELEDSQILELLIAGYGAIAGLVNYLKHRKK